MFNMNILARSESEEFPEDINDDWYTEEGWINEVVKVSGKCIDDATRSQLQALFNEEGVTIEQAARLI